MTLTEQIQARLEDLFPGLMGVEMTEVTQDRVRASLRVRPKLCTSGGILHGGAIMAFADTLGAIGTVVNMPEGARTATIESKTNFIGGAPVDAMVHGEATPIHRGKTTQVWQTRVTGADGKLVGIVTQTQIVMLK
ncbi:MAG: phenylacetic acid degradation protein [Betaproteobacteria bacterium SG8_39]|nr:MAG: phenylacetic acid degradation protein [Betaproteobacteria bacterium SG8_39]